MEANKANEYGGGMHTIYRMISNRDYKNFQGYKRIL